MKKALSLLMIGVLFLFVLSACGQKSQEEVMSALKNKLENLKGYKAEATMTLHAGDKPSKYSVKIWYQKPDHYRIHLENKKQNLSQMILKNDEGVFVLTPQLNKSYRFQSDWPENGSQWYLYESLLRDILHDPEPSFQRGDGTYVFKTKTNYRHKDLQMQKITLGQKNLKPVSVQIMNGDEKVIVDMNFTQMQFNAEFDDNAFDLKKNMTSATMKLSKKASGDGEKNSSSFQVFYPTERLGAKLASAKKAMTDDGKKYVFQYTGENSFTLVEQNAEAWSNTVEPASVSGTPVNLGFAIGHMTNNSISWTYQGTDFFLASKNLKPGQMVDVARSVFATKMK